MTEAHLVAKKLAFIESCIRDLEKLAQPERIEEDVREERFVAHTLQIAIQAAQDVASHIVSEERLGEPETNRELFALLQSNSWLREDSAKIMQDVIGFRNVVVHGYQTMDPAILKDIVLNHLDDLSDFVAQIRDRMKVELDD